MILFASNGDMYRGENVFKEIGGGNCLCGDKGGKDLSLPVGTYVVVTSHCGVLRVSCVPRAGCDIGNLGRV